ncbi:urease subunit alpha isoform X4, partial [Ixodes scapularis]
NIPAGTSVRFEPGDERSVPLVEIAGFQIVRGGNNLCDGNVDIKNLPQVMKRVYTNGFGHIKQVKLADTCLVVEVEKDHTSYGDEVMFGGGKVIRDGMGQASYRRSEEVLDVVITNALIIDAVLGIVKADVGIKGNTIVGIGKSGNPDVMAGVDPCLVIGCGTEVVAGEGLILTAGAIDTHVHYICPQIVKQ